MGYTGSSVLLFTWDRNPRRCAPWKPVFLEELATDQLASDNSDCIYHGRLSLLSKALLCSLKFHTCIQCFPIISIYYYFFDAKNEEEKEEEEEQDGACL